MNHIISLIQIKKGAADALKVRKKTLRKTASQKWKAVLVFMETIEDKKRKKLPRYITTKELDELMKSQEMKDLVKKLEAMEEYRKKTRNVSVGQY